MLEVLGPLSSKYCSISGLNLICGFELPLDDLVDLVVVVDDAFDEAVDAECVCCIDCSLGDD